MILKYPSSPHHFLPNLENQKIPVIFPEVQTLFDNSKVLNYPTYKWNNQKISKQIPTISLEKEISKTKATTVKILEFMVSEFVRSLHKFVKFIMVRFVRGCPVQFGKSGTPHGQPSARPLRVIIQDLQCRH